MPLGALFWDSYSHCRFSCYHGLEAESGFTGYAKSVAAPYKARVSFCNCLSVLGRETLKQSDGHERGFLIQLNLKHSIAHF